MLTKLYVIGVFVLITMFAKRNPLLAILPT